MLQVAVREQVPEEIDHRGKAFGGNRMTDISDMEAPGLLLLVESFFEIFSTLDLLYVWAELASESGPLVDRLLARGSRTLNPDSFPCTYILTDVCFTYRGPYLRRLR